MGYWKTKVVPRIRKFFDTKTGPNKKAAADACKDFDESKEKMDKELEEKKEELQPKVMEIYEGCTAEIKAVLKDPSVASVEKHSTLVNKLLEDLAQIDFPGSKKASEASAKYGPVLVSSSVLFVFEKVATFLPAEPEPEKAVEAEETHKEPPKEKEEEKTPAAAPAETPAAAVEVKKDEVEPVEVKKEVEQTPPPPPAAKEEAPTTEEPAPAKATEPETATKPAEGGKA